MTLRGPILAFSILGLASGCAGHDDKEGKAPVPASTTPTKDPEPAAVKVKVSVASVQLQDDCPSAKPAAAAPAEAEMQQEKSAGDVASDSARMGKGFAPMCTQSRVQLSIESDGDQQQSFAIRAVRLKKADGGDLLSTMSTRKPTLWEDPKYVPWDESIAAGATIKVGYSLGDPDWSKVGKALGGDTWGTMYIVEIDVEIGGSMQTVVSPKVPREQEEQVQT